MYMQKKNNNPGINITKNDVAKLISRPYMKAMSLENLVSAFRRTGLYRFDNSVILDSEVAPATIYNTSQNVSTEPEDLDITASEPKAQPFAGSEVLSETDTCIQYDTVTQLCASPDDRTTTETKVVVMSGSSDSVEAFSDVQFPQLQKDNYSCPKKVLFKRSLLRPV